MAGTWFAVAAMPAQRAHSRAYLATITRRRPTLRDIFRHFFAFEELLMLRLRVAGGATHRGVLSPDAVGFREFLASNSPALLGTFHVGHSDLTGFLLGPQEQRRIFMVRQRVANSHDTDILGARFGRWLTFIWVNEAENLLFALKDAIASGGSVALKCDRLEFSAKTDVFEFLGARRKFPFTIYHLSLIFEVPVILSVGFPHGRGETIIYSSPRYVPDVKNKTASLEQAHVHFQEFLRFVEAKLREMPEQWFNFLELNPVVA